MYAKGVCTISAEIAASQIYSHFEKLHMGHVFLRSGVRTFPITKEITHTRSEDFRR